MDARPSQDLLEEDLAFQSCTEDTGSLPLLRESRQWGKCVCTGVLTEPVVWQLQDSRKLFAETQ